MYARNAVYRGIHGWESFEPWLSRIEALPIETVWGILETVPPEWYDGEISAMENLAEQLMQRQAGVRSLITAFRESSRAPFLNWNQARGKAEEGRFVEPGWADDIGGSVM